MYNVFVRNWWKWEKSQYGKRLVPAIGARKTYLAHNVSESVARQICKEYNETHNAGVLSRKAEFESK